MKVKKTEYDAATGEYKEIYEEDLPSPEEPETPPEPTLEEKVQELQNNILNLQSVLISQKISGGGIKLTDSSGFPIRDFSMQGKTEQEENASIESPKEIINAGENGEIEVKVTGKNLFDISKIHTSVTKKKSVYHQSLWEKSISQMGLHLKKKQRIFCLGNLI